MATTTKVTARRNSSSTKLADANLQSLNLCYALVLTLILAIFSVTTAAERFEILLQHHSNEEAQRAIDRYLANLTRHPSRASPTIRALHGKIIVNGSSQQFRHFNQYWRPSTQGKRYLIEISHRSPKQQITKLQAKATHTTNRYKATPRPSETQAVVELGQVIKYQRSRSASGQVIWLPIARPQAETLVSGPLNSQQHNSMLELLFLPQHSLTQLGYQITHREFSYPDPDELIKSPAISLNQGSHQSSSRGVMVLDRWYGLDQLMADHHRPLQNRNSIRLVKPKKRHKTYLRLRSIKSD